jgi:hypothetical protein
MMSVQLLDKGFALSYGALITRIAKHFMVDMTGLREVQLERDAGAIICRADSKEMTPLVV